MWWLLCRRCDDSLIAHQNTEEWYSSSLTIPRHGHKDRRKCKGSGFCLVGRIYLIPRRASCFALDDLNYRMKCTRMIWKKGGIRPILQNRSIGNRSKDFNTFFLQSRSHDLCIFFCLYPSSMGADHVDCCVRWDQKYQEPNKRAFLSLTSISDLS